MKVITVASNLNDVGFNDFLRTSCEFYNLDAIVLEYEDVFLSNRIKDALLNVYLQNTSDDDVIFFSDATDTVFVSGEEEIIEKYKAFDSPLVFSAEINCWPDKSLEADYPVPDVHFKYVNSGGFIGQAKFIKEIYNKYPIFTTADNPSYLWSNQYYWNTIFKTESELIRIDHNCEIFYNTAIYLQDFAFHKQQLNDPKAVEILVRAEKERLQKDISIMHGRVKSNITNTFPCHIHFPGTISKSLMHSGYFDDLKPPKSFSSNE
ncbi:glycosyltransferase domain-containing protein [Mucilaginibacter galii]|uniref:PLOD1-3-like GT domain-containing protein n=1 Tax=Mucilaginibacter galii TaxID=2005073 RepID=A0A917JBX4_9SPHI|nr:glycosyltransferase domain-containing protein [Mucilaginibacter galii]GGI52269.1 hypothetical protein GCM10011425_34810 [Mucilaginibacter galii]